MKPQRGAARRGTVLIAVLVCMGIATTIVLGAVQTSLRQRRQVRQELQMVQTRWLMDAGIGRAIARLQAQATYDGETLLVSPALEKYSNATVRITVIRKDQPNDQVRLRITAQLGGSNELVPAMRRSKEVVVNTSK